MRREKLTAKEIVALLKSNEKRKDEKRIRAHSASRVLYSFSPSSFYVYANRSFNCPV